MTDRTSGTDPKVVAILSHVFYIGWLVALILNSNNRSHLGSFYIRQTLGIYILSVASSVVMIIPVLGWIAGLMGYALVVVLWFISLISALNGEEKTVPVLGEQFQEWFQSI